MNLWISLKAGAICAWEVWKRIKDDDDDDVEVSYRGFFEQDDLTWSWIGGDGRSAVISEQPTGKWGGTFYDRKGNPICFVGFDDLEELADVMLMTIHGTDDGNPPKN